MKRAWPISWHLYFIVFLTAAPLCVYIGAEIFREAQEEQREAEDLVLSLATTAAGAARERLREAERFTRALAQRPLVRALDPGHCDPMIEGLLPLLPSYTNVVVIDRERRFVCSSLPVPSAESLAPAHAGFFGALAGRFALSEVFRGPISNKLTVSAAYPVAGLDGAVSGALSVGIDLALLQPASDPRALPRNAHVRVIDSSGVLVASSTPNDAELGQPLRDVEIVRLTRSGATGTAQAPDTDGIRRIYGYTPVGASGWSAYAGVPVGELLDTARRRTRTSALTAVALLALASIAATLVARRIAASAALIERAMGANAAGDAQHAAVTGPRELRVLAGNYNYMLDARLAARQAVVESETRLRRAVRASNTGLWDWDMMSGRVYYSDEWKSQLGYAPHEIGDSPSEWADRLHPDERDSVIASQQAFNERTASKYEREFRMRHKDGTYRWIYSCADLVRGADGEPQRVVGTHVDITKRKELERALQHTVDELRTLSMRLIEAEEGERRAISRELHDRTGANVAGLRITLGLIAEHVAADRCEDAASLLEDARAVLGEISSEIRDVMSELRPAALDDFGLYPALLSYARGVASRLGIELKAHGGPIEPRPSAAVETALFRIAQEALTNMAKHAAATTVEIDLQARDGVFLLSVGDDGRGFDLRGGSGHGMRTMRERADAVGATLRIASAPGAGTRIEVEVSRS